jgi:peptidoglycan/LPS O-acetylase OafA/YrhL
MRKLYYLQGLRGIAALVVVAHHYFCVFYPAAVFGTGTTHGGWEHLFWTTPLGLIASGISPVCVFFVLSGYVLSLPYFGEGARDTPHLLAAVVKRPVRLAGLVVATMSISMILLRANLYFSGQLLPATGSPMLATMEFGPVSWAHFAKDLATDSFGSGHIYNQPLWTITFELLGSYLTFLFLLLFRANRLRWLAYLVVGLQFYNSFYIAFLVGIFCADLTKNHSSLPDLSKPARLLVVPLFLAGIYLASYGPHLDPSYDRYSWHAWLPRFGNSYAYPMAGACALFVSIALSTTLQRFFALSAFVYLGRISYAMYAIHFLVLRSFSSWLFLHLFGRWSYDGSALMTFCTSTLLIGGLAHVMTVYFDEKVIVRANGLAELWLRRGTGTEA